MVPKIKTGSNGADTYASVNKTDSWCRAALTTNLSLWVVTAAMHGMWDANYQACTNVATQYVIKNDSEQEIGLSVEMITWHRAIYRLENVIEADFFLDEYVSATKTWNKPVSK